MALIHEATISPRKDEIIGPWLRTRPWWDGVAERGPVGDFRLDDPAGDVGIQCFLFGSVAGSTLFVPVTYRGSALPAARAALIGMMQHSVLGRRWVYDGCADPTLVSVIVATICDGGNEAELTLRRGNGSLVRQTSTASVRGDGSIDLVTPYPPGPVRAADESDRTTVHGHGFRLVVARRVGVVLPTGPALIGSFIGGAGLQLATVSSSPE